jgi:hypothetical protein
LREVQGFAGGHIPVDVDENHIGEFFRSDPMGRGAAYEAAAYYGDFCAFHGEVSWNGKNSQYFSTFSLSEQGEPRAPHRFDGAGDDDKTV